MKEIVILSQERTDQMLPGFAAQGPAPEADWEFATANTQYLTHGLFPYPARLIPQIVCRLIAMYWTQSESGKICDVFCGSGTVLVESSLQGIPSIGVDNNPFAILLAKAKTTAVDVTSFDPIKADLRRSLQNFDGNALEEYVPVLSNLNHWFKPDVIAQLSYLRKAVETIADDQLKGVFKIAFAHAIMKSSNVDWKSSRYIRVMTEPKLQAHNPDAFTIFWGNIGGIEKRLTMYTSKKRVEVEVKNGDARALPIADSCIDLIVTSPPYGEERNTIPYIRWSRLFLLWLGFTQDNVKALETKSLGGISVKNLTRTHIPSNTFWEGADKVPESRLAETLSFMADYFVTLKEMQRVLRPNCKTCIVIGHRSISRVLIDMGKVTKELAEAAGMRHETTHYRNIPKKMIAWTGPTGDTMSQESIVIMSK